MGEALEWLRKTKSILGYLLVICLSGKPKSLQSLQLKSVVSPPETTVALSTPKPN